MTDVVLQFLNTANDFKDYYLVSHDENNDDKYKITHYIPNEAGVYEEQRMLPGVDVEHLYDNLDLFIPTSFSKSRIFLNPGLNINGVYNRFIFHNLRDARPITESNKFVGFFCYAQDENDPHGRVKQLVSIFKKRPNSLVSYELCARFNPLVDLEACMDAIQKLEDMGHSFRMYYYGNQLPYGIDVCLEKYMRQMPLAIQVTNRETCDEHQQFTKMCILCVFKDILLSPRRVAQHKNLNVRNGSRPYRQYKGRYLRR